MSEGIAGMACTKGHRTKQADTRSEISTYVNRMRTCFTLDPSQTDLNWTYVHPRVTLLKLPGKKDR